jgi:hypothetical protein
LTTSKANSTSSPRKSVLTLVSPASICVGNASHLEVNAASTHVCRSTCHAQLLLACGYELKQQPACTVRAGMRCGCALMTYSGIPLQSMLLERDT